VEVAYHGANCDLWTYVAGVGGHDSGLPITGWSSPAATTHFPGDGAEVAYQSFDGFVCVYNVTTGSTLRTGLNMAHGTSPAVYQTF
jgi:hypothetical protein